MVKKLGQQPKTASDCGRCVPIADITTNIVNKPTNTGGYVMNDWIRQEQEEEDKQYNDKDTREKRNQVTV